MDRLLMIGRFRRTWMTHATAPRLLVVMLAFAGGCHAAPPGPARDDEAEVIRQALSDALAVVPRQDSAFVSSRLDARTARAGDFDRWLDGLIPESFRRGISRDLFRRYWQANQRFRTLRLPETLNGVRIRPLEAGPDSTLPAAGGRYSVSRVGLGATADSALVSVQFACRGLCGQADLYLYVRRPTGWTLARNLSAVSN